MSKGYIGESKEDRIFNSFTRNIQTPHEEYRNSIQSDIAQRKAAVSKPSNHIINGKTISFGNKQTGKLVYSTNPETHIH